VSRATAPSTISRRLRPEPWFFLVGATPRRRDATNAWSASVTSSPFSREEKLCSLCALFDRWGRTARRNQSGPHAATAGPARGAFQDGASGPVLGTSDELERAISQSGVPAGKLSHSAPALFLTPAWVLHDEQAQECGRRRTHVGFVALICSYPKGGSPWTLSIRGHAPHT
jgi:hypothetical protein